MTREARRRWCSGMIVDGRWWKCRKLGKNRRVAGQGAIDRQLKLGNHRVVAEHQDMGNGATPATRLSRQSFFR